MKDEERSRGRLVRCPFQLPRSHCRREYDHAEFGDVSGRRKWVRDCLVLGPATLDKVAKFRPDFVILDTMLPAESLEKHVSTLKQEAETK